MEGQITLTEWMQWREDIRRKLQETASNFVYIGYRLKQIRDSGMFDGCDDIFEFAQKEYGLGKSITSRFIAINEKFSENGNSLEIREEFKALGSSKLSEMLTLSEEDCRLITERTTVKEIREIKHFNKQEPELEEESMAAVQYTPLQKCIIDFFKDKKEMLNEVIHLLDDGWKVEQASKVMNPGDYITHKKGIVFLFMYDFKNGVAYKMMGQSEPVTLTWDQFMDEIAKVYEDYYTEGCENTTWSNFYKTETQEKEAPEVPKIRENTPVATSQQSTEKDVELPVEEAVKIAESEGKQATELEEIEECATENTEVTRKVKLEIVPGVEVEIEDMGKASEEAKKEETKPVIEAAPTYTQEEPIANPEDAPLASAPVEIKEGDAEIFTPKKKENAEFEYQVRKCLNNLKVETDAKAWKAALSTLKHMEHYLEILQEES